MEFAEEIRDFLIESNENLVALDQEVVQLEENPTDERLIASVFRTIHTIKGTSGFFGFHLLGGMTHVAENILGQVRDRERSLTPALVSLVLETVDAIKLVLNNIEAHGEEGEDRYQQLRERLEAAYLACGNEAPDSVSAPAVVTVAELVEGPDAFADVPEILDGESTEARVETSPPAPKPESSEPASAEPVAAVEIQRNRRADDALVNSTIRVDVSLLDKLVNLVGELVLARNQILQGTEQPGRGSATAQRLNLITSELQEGVMRTRMQPIGMVWNKLPRVVRDLASELGKKIEMQMEGAETELDKTIIEAIKDPLTHIVRNSCDHGIESQAERIAKGKSPAGTILLRAFHEGGHVNIEIQDDGAGIDPAKIRKKAVERGLVRPEQAAQLSDREALRLIFMPGFSTAEKVTSISGRGVGMDVVKTNIEKISGTVEMANRPGAGTTIKIKIPLTLAIIPGLIVSVHSSHPGDADGPPREHRFVIPQASLLELVRLEGQEGRRQIETIHGAEVYRRRGKLLPLAHLSEVLQLPSARKPEDVLNIVVVKAEETAFGLVVDEVNDTQEIVVKALGRQLKALSCYLGATIMGDGKIALILDATGVARLANMLAPPERLRSDDRAEAGASGVQQMMLLFRAGRFPRLVLPLSMVARLEEIPRSQVEQAAGGPVVRYRDSILSLVSLARLLDARAADSVANLAEGPTGTLLQVIVLGEAEHAIGMVVDEILDIVDDAVTIRQPGTTAGLLGSGVVGGKITGFVDLQALFAAAPGGAARGIMSAPPAGRRVLLLDDRKLARGVLRGYLEMHGHQVVEALGVDEGLTALDRDPMDVVVNALGRRASADLRAGLAERPGSHDLRVIDLDEADVSAGSQDGTADGTQDGTQDGTEQDRAPRGSAGPAREDRAAILAAIDSRTVSSLAAEPPGREVAGWAR